MNKVKKEQKEARDEGKKAENGRLNVMRRQIRTLRFMLIAFVVLIMAASGLFSGTLLMLGWLFRFAPVRGLTPLLIVHVSIIICFVMGALISIFASKRMFRPLNQLIAATKKISAGDFSVRIPEQGGQGELAELIHSFNMMAKDLEGIELFRKDFINNFSHEFKTPIVSIRGFARQLYNDELTEEQRREYADIIIAESDRLAGMSSNVLLLSKLENQTIVTDKQSFYLDEQIRHEILMLEKAWERKNISFSPELEEIRYVGCSELMAHIWRNLLSNAIKFSPDGSEVKVNLYRRSGQIIVEVIDEGPGMDKETALHIFDKFYQGDTSHKMEGNGLGLAIAYRAAVLCGAALSVRSAPNCGCTFTVVLPETEELIE